MGGENVKHTGLGVHLYAGGAGFGVWAPFADGVWVMGDFNDWSDSATPLARYDDGCWYGDVPGAAVGHEYKYVIRHGDTKLLRNDPRALQLTASGGNSIIVDPQFDWGDDQYRLPPVNELVVYELHVGTFVRDDPAMPGTFRQAMTKLDYLADLGINVIEIMPCNSVWDDRWWGYTPDNIYAVESSYGGRRAFQEFVQAAHRRGIGVLLDVVYNHFSQDPGLDLWQFDGWSQDGKGGIYFYNDWRSHTPWGETRPDYGRAEVRQFITDNVAMWLRDCHVDGLRVDATLFMRNFDVLPWDHPDHEIPDGWKMLQQVSAEARQVKPDALMVAEDLQGNEWVTKPINDGGAGFAAQWDQSVSAIMREVMDPLADEVRDLGKIRFALVNRANDNPFQRVIYSESHDVAATAHGGARLDETIEPGNAGGLYARKRASLAAAIVLTAPGIPMLLQGQEFQEAGGFSHTATLDWSKAERFAGMLKLHKDLIALRRNRYNNTAGLLGKNVDVFHVDDANKLIAYHRWNLAGKGGDVVIVANFANAPRSAYQIAFPATGKWWVRLNTDWRGYSNDFTDLTVTSVDVAPDPNDPGKLVGSIDIASYAVLILSQDK
jgi:1,4-alpha-glucan branching enzyme